MRIVVVNHVTLDGVMQGPGRPDEDTRGGFTHGGWAEPIDPTPPKPSPTPAAEPVAAGAA